MSPRIASLFSGTGALDIAVQAVFGGEVVWHCQYEPPDKNGREDKNQYAAKILARHWPTVPNLWDITKVCWLCVLEEHGQPDILTGGFPCTDVSTAGKRAGLAPDTRSGLWSHMARAIHILQPRLVIIENVEGLLSSKADRGLEPGAEALDPDAGTGRVLRALGAVLGDLATLGFHAEWQVVAASAVGAPHQRKRVIIYAWPAALDPCRFGRGNGPRIVGGLGTEGRDAEAAADTADLGHERCRDTRDRRAGSSNGDLAAAHTCGKGLEVRGVKPDRDELPTAERGRRQPAADAHSVEPERRGIAGVLGSQAAAEPREGDQRERAGDTAGDRREAPADTDGRRRQGHQERNGGPEGGQRERERGLDPVGRGVRRPTVEPVCPTCGCGEWMHDAGGFCAGPCGGSCTDPELGRPDEAPADTDYIRRREDVLELRPGQPDLDWGDYGPAIRRWERVLGRPAPWPTDALGRLSPVFTEWLMGLPDGWVTCTPGLTRPAMLRALGNGVVPQQAIAALQMLHRRACQDTDEAAA